MTKFVTNETSIGRVKLALLHYFKKGKNMNQDNTSSNNRDDSPQVIMKSRQYPTLLMQAEPRQVVAANKSQEQT